MASLMAASNFSTTSVLPISSADTCTFVQELHNEAIIARINFTFWASSKWPPRRTTRAFMGVFFKSSLKKKRSLLVQLWRVCRSLCPARAVVTVQLCASGARSFGKSVAASVAHKKREPTRQFHAQAANIEFLFNSVHALPQPHC